MKANTHQYSHLVRDARRTRGFTLIEMVFSIVILGILGAGIAPIFLNGLRAYSGASDNLATLTKLRFATERMAREIRQVRRDPITPSNYDISTMTATSLVFARLDSSGAAITVTITASAPNVTMQYSTPSVTAILTDQLNANSDLNFAYYQADGVTAATGVSDVAFVQISLTLTQGGLPTIERTRVALRNQS